MKIETPELTVLNRAIFYIDDANYLAARQILLDRALKLHEELSEVPEHTDMPEWMKQPRFSCIEPEKK